MDDVPVTNAQCQKRSSDILAAIQKLDDRLYHDNGRISIQTRLDRHERLLSSIVWALSIGGGALIVLVVGFVFRAMTGG
jgi:hypothetical protein